MSSPSAPDRPSSHPGDVRDARVANREEAREAIRQVRQAGRDAVRQARETARTATRESLEMVRESMRNAREAEVRVARGRARGGEEGDTRSRIQQVALELFTERGYEATSLREIAEELGVTKAALYYHFKTKDEILDSMVLDRVERVEELIAWAQDQPRTLELRREVIRRYSDLLHAHDHQGFMRFFERNQSSMAHQRAGAIMKERMLQMLEVLTDADEPLAVQIRRSLAIFALHSTWLTVRDPDISQDQRREAALEVALDLIL